MKPIMTVRASWSVQASECSGYGPNSGSKAEVEVDDTPTNILFARELIKMGMSILEKSSPYERDYPVGPSMPDQFVEIPRPGESVSDQIKQGVIPRRPDGSVCYW